jgi:hypothetical protein
MTDEPKSLTERFQELNEKLDLLQKATGLILAAIAQLPIEVDAKLLRDLGWQHPSSTLITKL